MARTSLLPGFRFHPTDIELVMYHLKRKVMGKNVKFEVISELYIYKFSPWDLPDKSCLGSKDLEWYFFCPKETKYANGARMNRATDCGYWKSTGKDRCVSYNDRTVAMVKTLVFHTGHPPKGERTDWVMHEYRMVDKELADAGVVQDAYVLCKVFHKSGPGPKNGAQYGAPFNEDDYDDDGEICAESSLPVALPPPALASNNSLGGSVYCPGSTSSWISSDSVSVPGSTSIGPLSDPGPSKDMLCDDELPPDIFIVDNLLHSCENGNNEAENFGLVTRNEGSACLDGNDIYSDLEDLKTTGFGFTPMLAGNDLDFLELIDLDSQLDPALNQSPLQSPLCSDSLIKWDPPPAEATKLNTGGCWYQSNGKAGFGGLFRSKEGVWLLGFYGKVECNSSLETELWGIYRGLTIILEKGMANITIETDSQEAVKLINGGPDPSCPRRVLVDESRRLMNRTGSSLYHIYREANECAEQLARFGAEQDEHLLVYEF